MLRAFDTTGDTTITLTPGNTGQRFIIEVVCITGVATTGGDLTITAGGVEMVDVAYTTAGANLLGYLPFRGSEDETIVIDASGNDGHLLVHYRRIG